MTKRKILIIVENLPVPFDARVWKEARALHQHGYEVTVLCPRGKGFRKTHEILEGVHIYRHPMPPEGNTSARLRVEYTAAHYSGSFSLLVDIPSSWIPRDPGLQSARRYFPGGAAVRIFGVKYIFDHHDANPELYLVEVREKGFIL